FCLHRVRMSRVRSENMTASSTKLRQLCEVTRPLRQNQTRSDYGYRGHYPDATYPTCLSRTPHPTGTARSSLPSASNHQLPPSPEWSVYRNEWDGVQSKSPNDSGYTAPRH